MLDTANTGRWKDVVQNDARSHNPLPGRSQRGRTRNQSFVHEEWAGSGEWVTSGWTGGQWGVSRRGELHWDSRHVKCRVGRHETQNKSWGGGQGTSSTPPYVRKREVGDNNKKAFESHAPGTRSGNPAVSVMVCVHGRACGVIGMLRVVCLMSSHTVRHVSVLCTSYCIRARATVQRP